MCKIKVIVMGPGEFPSIVEVEASDSWIAKTDDGEDTGKFDSYAIASDLINEWSESNVYVQRFNDISLEHLGFFVDEDGRCTGVKANRIIELPSGAKHKIAGRLVIVPDYMDRDNCLFVTDSEFCQRNYVQDELDEFISYNNNDGSDPDVFLS